MLGPQRAFGSSDLTFDTIPTPYALITIVDTVAPPEWITRLELLLASFVG